MNRKENLFLSVGVKWSKIMSQIWLVSNSNCHPSKFIYFHSYLNNDSQIYPRRNVQFTKLMNDESKCIIFEKKIIFVTMGKSLWESLSEIRWLTIYRPALLTWHTIISWQSYIHHHVWQSFVHHVWQLYTPLLHCLWSILIFRGGN